MTRRALILVALLLPPMAGAQRIEPVAMRSEARQATVPRTDTPMTMSQQLPVRALIGVGSAFAGAFAGAYTGAILPRSPCGCDDPGLQEAVFGAMVGSVIVPAILAAMPEMDSTCSFAKRAGFGLAGSVVGAALGGVAGAMADGNGPGVVVGYIGGSGLGAALGSGLCR